MKEDFKIEKNKPLVKNQEPIFRNEIPSLFMDSFHIAMRSDNTVFLSGLQSEPNGNLVEQVRLVLTLDHAQKLVEGLQIGIKHHLDNIKTQIAKDIDQKVSKQLTKSKALVKKAASVKKTATTKKATSTKIKKSSTAKKTRTTKKK
jgi:hypothetical protein